MPTPLAFAESSVPLRLANFIRLSTMAATQKELEEEYWRVHEWQRMKRDAKKMFMGKEKKSEFEITPDMIPRWYKGDYQPPDNSDEDGEDGDYED